MFVRVGFHYVLGPPKKYQAQAWRLGFSTYGCFIWGFEVFKPEVHTQEVLIRAEKGGSSDTYPRQQVGVSFRSSPILLRQAVSYVFVFSASKHQFHMIRIWMSRNGIDFIRWRPWSWFSGLDQSWTMIYACRSSNLTLTPHAKWRLGGVFSCVGTTEVWRERDATSTSLHFFITQIGIPVQTTRLHDFALYQ